MTVHVSRARIYDWPALESLRKLYFARRNQDVQRRSDDVTWNVAIEFETGRVVGCYSYSDELGYGQRWILDFYVCDGRVGRAAAKAMGDTIVATAADAGLAIAGTIAPDNEPFYRFLSSCGFEPVGIIMLRPQGERSLRRRRSRV